MDRTIRLTVLFAFCLVSLPAAGCQDSGPELGRVTGTATLDGKPLPNATVEFQPGPGGSPSYGTTDENGRYELSYSVGRPGAMVGKHVVRISTFRQDAPDDEGLRPVIEYPELLPPRYNEESELTAEVKPGRNEGVNFNLKSR